MWKCFYFVILSAAETCPERNPERSAAKTKGEAEGRSGAKSKYVSSATHCSLGMMKNLLWKLPGAF